MSTSLCYITVGSRDEALAIGRALVEDRWRGAIEQDDEVVLIAKTRTDLVDRLTARVKALHSYDCPCVVALPIERGNPDYIAWIEAETRTD